MASYIKAVNSAPDVAMPHFTPKVYLKNFSTDARNPDFSKTDEHDTDHRQINILLTANGRVQLNASLRQQGRKKHFYGFDPEVEEFLKIYEGRYGLAMKEVAGSGVAVSPDILLELRSFLHLQYSRTLAVEKRHDQKRRILGRETGQWAPTSRKGIPSINNYQRPILPIMEGRLALGLSYHSLETRLLENKTTVDLITSDDPVFFGNTACCPPDAYSTLDDGAFYFMPLSPRYMLICYDARHYKIGEDGLQKAIDKEADIHLFNECQMLDADSCIYFSNLESSEELRRQFLALQHKRQSEQYRVQTWPSMGPGGHRNFGKPTAELSVYRRFMAPSMWPSILRRLPKTPMPAHIQDKLDAQIRPITYPWNYLPVDCGWPRYSAAYPSRPAGPPIESILPATRVQQVPGFANLWRSEPTRIWQDGGNWPVLTSGE